MLIDIKTSFVNDEMILPKYAHPSDACMDLQANIEEPFILSFEEQKLISTGISVALKKQTLMQTFELVEEEKDFSWVLDIVSRSGLSNRGGIIVLNAPGKIDETYRGVIHVILKNTGNFKFTVTPGMRIAQMQLSRAYNISWNEVSELGDTDRGSGGFGSTGL